MSHFLDNSEDREQEAFETYYGLNQGKEAWGEGFVACGMIVAAILWIAAIIGFCYRIWQAV